VPADDDENAGNPLDSVRPERVILSGGTPARCSATDRFDNPEIDACGDGAVEFQGTTQVTIDIRPNNESNRVNSDSTKTINVAILSQNGFDATMVDSTLVRFGAVGSEAAPFHAVNRDVNGDGQRDLVLRFQIQDLGIECGTSSLTLTGRVFHGQAVAGSSPIITTGCHPKGANKR
jgi:hypothetical protein